MSDNPYINDVLRNAAQNSKAWDQIRLGRFTGSGISALLTQGKRKMTPAELEARPKGDKRVTVDVEFGDGAMTYITEKAMEVATGTPNEKPTTRAMEWGNEWEEHALRELAKAIGCSEENMKLKPPFKVMGEYSGCSPDALMIYDGVHVGCEIKCPANPVIHYNHSQIKTGEELKAFDIDKYFQVQMNIVAHKMPLWLWGSYDPRQPDHRRLHFIPVYFNEVDCTRMLDLMEKAIIIRNQIIRDWMQKP